MKKLLSLLSVLTISGTAVPTIVAFSSYDNTINKKTKQEKLSRVKRDNEVDFKRSVTSDRFLIITNVVNWGRNFAIQIGYELCSKIKNYSIYVIKSGLRYVKEAIIGASAGIGGLYVYSGLSGKNETYSYSEVLIAGAVGSAGNVAQKLSSDIMKKFIALLSFWIENPNSFKYMILNSYIYGKDLLFSFLNEDSVPVLQAVRVL